MADDEGPEQVGRAPKRSLTNGMIRTDVQIFSVTVSKRAKITPVFYCQIARFIFFSHFSSVDFPPLSLDKLNIVHLIVVARW